MVNSRRKGKAGELEACHALNTIFDCNAHRGQQHSGTPDSPDIKHSMGGIHFEVKRCERLSVYVAMEQAIGDADNGIPAVLHRRNGKGWLVVVRLEDMEMLRQVLNDWRIKQCQEGGER